MKGIINKGIQEMIEAVYGPDNWEKVKSRAGCEEPFFAISQDYPDEMTIELIKAASEVSELPMESVMMEFGKFLIQNTFKENYPIYFRLAGSSSRELLLNANRIHKHVRRESATSIENSLEYDELPDGRLLIKYRSNRKLCPILRGVIQGIGTLFDERLSVRETMCMLNGDRYCLMEVTFN